MLLVNIWKGLKHLALIGNSITNCKIFWFLKATLFGTTDDKCDIEVNQDVFILTLIMGTCFSLAYIFVGIVINIFGNKNILGKY